MRCGCGRVFDSLAIAAGIGLRAGVRCSLCNKKIDYDELSRLHRAGDVTPVSVEAGNDEPPIRKAQKRALGFVRSYAGKTARELAVLAGDVDDRTIGRRLPELERMGFIERTGERNCEVSGRLAAIWCLRK